MVYEGLLEIGKTSVLPVLPMVTTLLDLLLATFCQVGHGVKFHMMMRLWAKLALLLALLSIHEGSSKQKQSLGADTLLKS